VSWTRIVESFIGTAGALLVVVGARQLVARISYRAMRAALRMRGRLGK
jgi:hypothetical protein